MKKIIKIRPYKGNSTEHVLKSGITTLGRAPQNTIIMTDESISRYHAKIINKSDQVYLEDWKSRNGIILNGKYIKEKTVLNSGDEFFIGKTTILFLEDKFQKIELKSDKSILQDKQFDSRYPNEVSEKMLSSLSETIAVGHSEIREIEKDNSRFRILFQISNLSQYVKTLDQLCQKIVELLFNNYRANRIFLMLFDEESNELIPKGIHCNENEAIGINKEIVDKVMKENIALITHTKDDNSRTIMCVPLQIQKEAKGIIFIETAQKPAPTTWDLETLTIIANQSSIIIENMMLYQNLIEAKYKLTRENIELKNEVQQKYSFNEIIGSSPAMEKVFHILRKVIPTDSTVLILGDSGTGKELVAKTIHYNSNRKDKPFITINCAAIPENLLEAELFGIEKGIATGVDHRIGNFEEANHGTIFLDEIGEISIPVQIKLLRVLENKEISRIGSGKTKKVDIRILTATNADLNEKIQQNKFRSDLYYRLNVLPINLPPLRRRKQDIPELANHFIKEVCKKEKKRIKGLSTEAWNKLVEYDWPGNVRELKNEIERLIIMADNNALITPKLLSEKINVAKSFSHMEFAIGKAGLKELAAREVEKIEAEIILQAMKIAKGKKTKTAKILKLSREGLRQKMIRYHLNDI